MSHAPLTLVGGRAPAVLAGGDDRDERCARCRRIGRCTWELVAPLMAEHEAVVGGWADVVVHRSH